MFGKSALIASGFGLLASAAPGHVARRGYGHGDIKLQDPSKLISDPLLTYGPELEVVHYYYDQWPTGIAVSKEGRLFSNYPGGLDPANAYRGGVPRYTVAELNPDNTETPYPSAEINMPPGGAINYTTHPPTGANYKDYFIGVQSVVIDSANRLWVLDTGRVLTPHGILVASSHGGPKLVGIDLATDEIFQTITFPVTVAYPDSYLNDVRFDLRPELTPSGKGVAYITDSSTEGRNGIVIVDLGTGDSHRHLDRLSKTHPLDQWVAYAQGNPLYLCPPGAPYTYTNFGSDGITLSADGNTLYWKVVAGRYLYSIPTKALRDNGPYSEIFAEEQVVQHTETGSTDGMETDTNGFIYHGNMEQDAVSFFNPANGTDTLFIRDPRLNWIDTFSTGEDGYLYFTNNQLYLMASFYPCTDRRQYPYSLIRVPLPAGGSKPILA